MGDLTGHPVFHYVNQKIIFFIIIFLLLTFQYINVQLILF